MTCGHKKTPSNVPHPELTNEATKQIGPNNLSAVSEDSGIWTWFLVAARIVGPVCCTSWCTRVCCMMLGILWAVVCLASMSLSATSTTLKKGRCAVISAWRKRSANRVHMRHVCLCYLNWRYSSVIIARTIAPRLPRFQAISFSHLHAPSIIIIDETWHTLHCSAHCPLFPKTRPVLMPQIISQFKTYIFFIHFNREGSQRSGA